MCSGYEKASILSKVFIFSIKTNILSFGTKINGFEKIPTNENFQNFENFKNFKMT